MTNETVCKVLCHNPVVLIHEMYELGIDQFLGQATRLPNNLRVRPKFPLPQEGMALIFLTKACLSGRAFWLQGEGDAEPIEGALLECSGRRDFVELDRRI